MFVCMHGLLAKSMTNLSREWAGYLVSSKKAIFMVLMSTSVCALAKMATSPPLTTLRVFHTTIICGKMTEQSAGNFF